MIGKTSGRQAEQAVADYMRRSGYTIRAQNWRTRYCEIDIVATKRKAALIIEVKYRTNSVQGDGFSYITPQKIRQLQFAAELWQQTEQWNGTIELVAAAVSGANFERISMLPVELN